MITFRRRVVWACFCSVVLACSGEEAREADAGTSATTDPSASATPNPATTVPGTPGVNPTAATPQSTATPTSPLLPAGSETSEPAAPSVSGDDPTSMGGTAGGSAEPDGAAGTGGAAGAGGTDTLSTGGTGGTAATGGAPSSQGGAGSPSNAGGTSGAGSVPDVSSPCPTDGSPCAILPLGDSITFGEGSSGGGYRVGVFERAVNNGERVTFIGTAAPNGPDTVAGQPFPRAHQGHQGYVIDTGGFSPTASLSQVVDMVLPNLDPHLVLLMIGTNDVNGNNNLGDAPNRLGALIDKIISAEPDAVIVVAQLTPTQDAALNGRIETYNAAMVDVVEARAMAGQHVMLVDMYGAFTSNPNYQSALLFDRLHPNDAGYEAMAEVWYEAISDLLPAQ